MVNEVGHRDESLTFVSSSHLLIAWWCDVKLACFVAVAAGYDAGAPQHQLNYSLHQSSLNTCLVSSSS